MRTPRLKVLLSVAVLLLPLGLVWPEPTQQRLAALETLKHRHPARLIAALGAQLEQVGVGYCNDCQHAAQIVQAGDLGVVRAFEIP